MRSAANILSSLFLISLSLTHGHDCPAPLVTLKGVRQWIKQYIKNAEAESAAKLAKASSKGSPIRTRLRSLSSGPKKSPVKQLKMPVKEESSNLPLPKVPRKSSLTSPRNSGPKVGRQNTRVLTLVPQQPHGHLRRQVGREGAPEMAPGLLLLAALAKLSQECRSLA